MFTLHYGFLEQKIAINFHLKKFSKTTDSSVSQMQKLPEIVLSKEGWEIFDISQAEFDTWDFETRVTTIKTWLKQAKERQMDKGIIERNPPQYV